MAATAGLIALIGVVRIGYETRVPDGMPPAVALSPSTTPPTSVSPASNPSPACRTLTEDEELGVTSQGIVGATLGPAIRAGVDEGFVLGPLAAVQSPDTDREVPWTVVSALVWDDGGERLGVATWLSAGRLAVFSGGDGSVTVENFRADPATHITATHVWAANDVAEAISAFARTAQKAEAETQARRCAIAASLTTGD